MGLITLLLLLLFALLFGATAFEDESPVVVSEPARPVMVGAGTPPTQDDSWDLTSGEDYAGVIVPEADAADFAAAAGWEPTEAYWTPTDDDIAALEEELEAAFEAEVPPQDRVEDLIGYLRQYVGAIEAGERTIVVNAFCEPGSPDWPSEPIVVADGGVCYFQATWNVELAEFTSLTVNGEA